jgi:hypothetical protein
VGILSLGQIERADNWRRDQGDACLDFPERQSWVMGVMLRIRMIQILPQQ